MSGSKKNGLKLISLLVVSQVVLSIIIFYPIKNNNIFAMLLLLSCLIISLIILLISYYIKNKKVDKLENLINEQKYIINRLMISKEKEEEQFELLSDVSHELRTPLTSIIGFAKIINRRLTKVIVPYIHNSQEHSLSTNSSEMEKITSTVGKITENIDIIISESERLTALINNLLDFSKLRSDKIDWNIEITDLRELISKGILISYSLLENKNIELNDEIDEDIPPVYVDKNKILQVIINLLSNAIKFTKEGSIVCRAKLYDNNQVLVSIEDSGIGIPKEYYNKIFQRFEQIPSGDEKPQGSGLGLVICKAIVEKHGGKMWLESEVNKGSTFYFTVPINESEGEYI